MKLLIQALFAATAAQAAAVIHNSDSAGADSRLNARGADPLYGYDPNTSTWCIWWHDNEDNSVSCKDIPAYWDITEAQWKKWNPTIAQSCDNYVTEKSYCVDADEPPPGSVTTTRKPPTVTKPSTPTTTKPSNGITTPSPSQPGMVDNCDKFYKVQDKETCDPIVEKNGITMDQLITWNPSIGEGCRHLFRDTYICVSIIGHEPTPPGMVKDCDAFYQVKDNEGCEAIAKSHGITPAQFLKWNPTTKADCGGLWRNVYVCVSIIGHEPTPTKPGNGITTPTPIQSGMVDNCDKFHFVKKEETCDDFLLSYGITRQQFAQWNKDAGSECRGIWANTYVCVSIIGHEPSPTKPGNGITTPTPIQDGMTKNCKKFHKLQKDQNCDYITNRYQISFNQFLSWNPVARRDCSGLWANTCCCVAVLSIAIIASSVEDMGQIEILD